jgi:integrase
MAIFKRGRVYWYDFTFRSERIQQSTRQGNQNVARQMEAAHRTALAKGEVGIVKKVTAPTLERFCSDRIEPWASGRFEQNTWRWYRAGLRTIYAYPALASLKLDDITSEHADAFAAHRKGKGLEVATVNASLRVLRRVLRLALRWKVISAIPDITLLSGERHRERVITPEEEAKYLGATSDLLTAIATVLADTGMRPDEVYRLKWEHITFSAGKYGNLLIASGKTVAARRILPLTQRVRSLMEERWTKAGEPQEGWIFAAPTQSGHADHSTLKKQHTRALKDSRVRPFVLYSLRHTFATRLAENGIDAWALCRIMGWSVVSMAKRYVHLGDDTILRAMSQKDTLQLPLQGRDGTE